MAYTPPAPAQNTTPMADGSAPRQLSKAATKAPPAVFTASLSIARPVAPSCPPTDAQELWM